MGTSGIMCSISTGRECEGERDTKNSTCLRGDGESRRLGFDFAFGYGRLAHGHFVLHRRRIRYLLRHDQRNERFDMVEFIVGPTRLLLGVGHR